MFIPIQKILTKAYTRLGVKTEFEAALICEKYRKIAPRLIHTNALNHTFPKSYKEKTLTIGVKDSAWASQVAAKKQELIRLINESLGKSAVLRIQTKVSEQKSH